MRMNKKLKETTLRFIELNGFEELTNVQEEVLKYAGSGKDVIALSKTGTGKTHAYLIPIMEMINPVSNSHLAADQRTGLPGPSKLPCHEGSFS